MASVTLIGLWLHDAADLDDFVVVSQSSMRDEPRVRGRVQSYANGSLRSITRPGKLRAIPVVAPVIDPSITAWLDEKEGRRLLMRPQRRGLYLGHFYDLTVTPNPAFDRDDVAFTFQVTGTPEDS